MMEATSRPNIEDKRCRELVPARVVLAVMFFLATFVNYMIQVNLSLAIGAMTPYYPPSDDYSECGSQQETLTPASPEPSPTPPDHGPRYDWDSSTISVISLAYFAGSMMTGFFGGLLADIFGGRCMVLWTTLTTGVLSMLVPRLAGMHWGYVALARLLTGFFVGPCWPSLHSLISKWAPPDERSKFIWCLFGNILSLIVMMPLGKAIVESLGWPAMMYITGMLAITWCPFWWYLVHDTPDHHPRISPQEREYIANALSDSANRQRPSFPYCRMSFSLPFWLLSVAHFGSMWGNYFFISMAPTYMQNVHGFVVRENVGLILLPHAARLLCGLAFSCAGDRMLSRQGAITWTVRRWFTVSSHLIPALMLVAMGYTGCNVVSCLALLTLGMGFSGASTVTNLANQHDLAPNFAGSLYGSMQTLGSLGGILNSFLFNISIGYGTLAARWRFVMNIVGAAYFVTGLLFIMFGTADRQSWNERRNQHFVAAVVLPPRQNIAQFPAAEREHSQPTGETTAL